MSRGRMSRGGGRGGLRGGRTQRTPWWTLVVPISYQPLTALLVSRSARTPGVVYGVFVRPGECFIEVGSRPRASRSIVLNSLTTVELQDGELAQELDRLAVAKAVVVHNLLGLGRRDALPVDLIALGLVVQVTAEEGKEVVHLSLKAGLLVLVGDGVGKVVEGIAHLRRGNRGGSVLEGLVDVGLGQYWSYVERRSCGPLAGQFDWG